MREERAPDINPISRSRVSEDFRKLSPTYDDMDMNLENEENVPSQGDFGTPRDRQSGEPDVARLSSNEGTTEMASASVPVEQVATAEFMDDHNNEDAPLASRKRKASTSPGSDADGTEIISIRRPNKASVIESTEERRQEIRARITYIWKRTCLKTRTAI